MFSFFGGSKPVAVVSGVKEKSLKDMAVDRGVKEKHGNQRYVIYNASSSSEEEVNKWFQQVDFEKKRNRHLNNFSFQDV